RLSAGPAAGAEDGRPGNRRAAGGRARRAAGGRRRRVARRGDRRSRFREPRRAGRRHAGAVPRCARPARDRLVAGRRRPERRALRAPRFAALERGDDPRPAAARAGRRRARLPPARGRRRRSRGAGCRPGARLAAHRRMRAGLRRGRAHRLAFSRGRSPGRGAGSGRRSGAPRRGARRHRAAHHPDRARAARRAARLPAVFGPGQARGALPRAAARPARRDAGAHRPRRSRLPAPVLESLKEIAMNVHSRVAEVTRRIIERSRPTRSDYLARIEAARREGPRRAAMACGNFAHTTAGCSAADKADMAEGTLPNIGIVTAYNDMLSAHRPYEDYPKKIRAFAREFGGTAQVAGGVPAMCDGVTQGRAGMELSLFSRDVIALATAVALSHDAFDAAVCLGICDKIVPGLVIGAATFGHLPVVLIPGGPMPTGISNPEKNRVRQAHAAGKATREQLLEAEMASYHAPGTCTFYGTANSNQMLMECMGLHIPGASFENPGTELREALTREGIRRALAITALGDAYTPIGHVL